MDNRTIEAYTQSLTPLLNETCFDTIKEKLAACGWFEVTTNGDTVIYSTSQEECVLRLCNNAFYDSHAHHVRNALKYQENAYMPCIYWFEVISGHSTTGISFTLMEYLEEYDEHREDYELLYQAFPHYAEDISIPERTYDEFPELVEALELLKKPLHTFNLSSDIRNDNVMLRNDGHLVIIDPYTNC